MDDAPHLRLSVGAKAVETGFSVAFFWLDKLLHALKQDTEIPLCRLRRKKYVNVALLILDEVGF